MGKGSQTTTQNTVAEPWSAVQPHLRQAADDVLDTYQAGGFSVQPYSGPRVGPQSGLTQGGQDWFASMAGAGDPFLGTAGGAYPSLFNMMPQSWLTQAGQSGVAQNAMGFNPVRAGAMYGFGQAMQGPEGGLGGLGGANAMLGEYTGDPQAQLDELKQNVLADVVPATSHLFSQSGMLDSSMAQDTVGRAAAEAVAPIEYGAWENARNRGLQAMSQAAGMEQGAYENARARQMQALGLSPELMAARYTDPLMAMQAGQLSDQHFGSERDRMASALGMAGDLSRSRFAGPQAMSLAGQSQDAYNQALADAAMSQHYETQNMPYDEMQKLSSLLLGYGGLGKSQTETVKQPGGGIMDVLGPLAQIGGNIALMSSDRRIKTDVRHIGHSAEGYPTYAFRYLWEVPGTEHVGVMADEVPPEIVHEIAGVTMVDYEKVTL